MDVSSPETAVDRVMRFRIFTIAYRLVVSIVLLALGLFLCYWAYATIEAFINTPTQIPLINHVLKFQENQQIINIVADDHEVVIRYNDFFKWLILLFVIFVLFNVMGRAIMAVFRCLSDLLTNLELGSLRIENRKSIDANA